jgi:peptide/nickel transport system permease protein
MTYALRKSLLAAITLWLVLTLVFIGLRSAGDPALIMLPQDAPAQAIESFRRTAGLDQPLLIQYARYILRVLQGDLGRSLLDGRAVTEIIAERLPRTLLLMGSALICALLFGAAGGIAAALRQGSFLDRAVSAATFLAMSTPAFVVAILLILFFSIGLRLLPSGGAGTLAHVLLPTLAIAFGWTGQIARITRASMSEVLQQPFMRAARARGVGRFDLVLRHALPNAAAPILVMLGFLLGGLAAGAIVVETVFAYPGIGASLVMAVKNRDLPVVQGIALLLASSTVAAQLAVDILQVSIDPRLRDPRAQELR